MVRRVLSRLPSDEIGVKVEYRPGTGRFTFTPLNRLRLIARMTWI